jgi:hypothetical protein
MLFKKNKASCLSDFDYNYDNRKNAECLSLSTDRSKNAKSFCSKN